MLDNPLNDEEETEYMISAEVVRKMEVKTHLYIETERDKRNDDCT